MNDEKHRPFVIVKRTVDKKGQNNGCLVQTDKPNVTARHDLKQMYDNYVDGYDYEIVKGNTVSELIVIHRKDESGMSYHFRTIHNNEVNDNFNALESEVYPE